MKTHEIIQTAGKKPIPRMSQVRVNPNTRVAMTSGKKKFANGSPSSAVRKAAAQQIESRSWRRIKACRNASLCTSNLWCSRLISDARGKREIRHLLAPLPEQRRTKRLSSEVSGKTFGHYDSAVGVAQLRARRSQIRGFLAKFMR